MSLSRRLQCGVALFSRITEQQAYAEVVLVNEGFRSRQLPAPAYAFWEAHGVVVQAWVLASFMLNDEGPCYCGNLIAPDGQPWFFQVDFGDQDNCAWERVDELPRDTRHAMHMGRILCDELREARALNRADHS